MQVEYNWIKSPKFDSLFILLPPFICLLLIAIFPQYFIHSEMDEISWLILILLIDVAHVYSTIYRTYMDKELVLKNKFLFLISPLILYSAGVILHQINSLYFWRILAYFAVFHFIRQQYGFMRIYDRANNNKNELLFDKICIYSFTILPVLYWHFNGPQKFNWFVSNDFYYINYGQFLPFVKALNITLFIAYIIKEIYITTTKKKLNSGKILIMIGTALSWHMGIIYFKGDLTFTLLNVVSHGIPYMALVWAYGNKTEANTFYKLFKPQNILWFIGIIIGLAYIEEMLWDNLIWHDHVELFPNFFQADIQNKIAMNILVPLLALPQMMHYYIDGFIWKLKKDSFGWFSKLFNH